MDTELIGVLLVKSDSKGDRLLFRYPYLANTEANVGEKLKKNPYALLVTEDSLYRPSPIDDKETGQLTEFSDDVLTALFAVKPDLSEHKFEIKVNGIRFIGHPTSIKPWVKSGVEKKHKIKQRKVNNPPCILLNVVFALKASSDYSIVKCYHDFSRRIGISVRHEEKRCGYFVEQMKLMMMAHDMITTRADDIIMEELETNPYDDILEKSSLAKNLKSIYDSLCSKGSVCLRMNNWVELRFCIPQKVHSIDKCNLTIRPADVERCLQNMKPYHGLLLLVDVLQVLQSLSPDSSPSLIRFLKAHNPIKNFQILACDADLTLAQVFNLTGHLLYWGKAIVIYPLCENNVYVVTPCANISSAMLVDEFSEIFPNHHLYEVLSEFSLPTTMSQKLNPLTHSDEQIELVQMVVWMLQHRLIMQLHTYVYFMPTKKGVTTFQSVDNGYEGLYESASDYMDGSKHSVSDGEVQSISGNIEECDISPIKSKDYDKVPMTTFQTEPNSWFNISLIGDGERIEGFIIEDDIIANFSDDERTALLKVPASSVPEDFHLLIRLLKQGYLQGSHHIEEIMYLENIRRNQLIQILEKFTDILVTSESEDPAVSLFYPVL